MPRTTFTDADFLAAACALAAKRGPAAVTVESVTARLKAPTGSFYYRFASRDVLLGELWLTTARAFQEGFIAAIATGRRTRCGAPHPHLGARPSKRGTGLPAPSPRRFRPGRVAGRAAPRSCGAGTARR